MFSLGTLRSEVLVAEMEVGLSGIKDIASNEEMQAAPRAVPRKLGQVCCLIRGHLRSLLTLLMLTLYPSAVSLRGL